MVLNCVFHLMISDDCLEDKTPTNGAVTNTHAYPPLSLSAPTKLKPTRFLFVPFLVSSSCLFNFFTAKNMANSIPLFLPFSILLLLSIPITVSSIPQDATTTVARDQVPCTMCTECENPCKPLPPPPPTEIECPPPPPPPSPSPPPPLPPPPPPVLPPPPPPVLLCPPPPKPPCTGPCETLPPPASSSCPENCETPPSPPEKPCEDGTCVPTPVQPMPLVPPGYYPPPAPGNPYPVVEEPDENLAGKLKPFAAFWLSLLLLVPLI